MYYLSVPIPAADVGKWVNLVGENDGSNWKLYDDGQLLGTAAASVGAIQVGADWTIGAVRNH